jgi:hypothetical protein
VHDIESFVALDGMMKPSWLSCSLFSTALVPLILKEIDIPSTSAGVFTINLVSGALLLAQFSTHSSESAVTRDIGVPSWVSRIVMLKTPSDSRTRPVILSFLGSRIAMTVPSLTSMLCDPHESPDLTRPSTVNSGMLPGTSAYFDPSEL